MQKVVQTHKAALKQRLNHNIKQPFNQNFKWEVNVVSEKPTDIFEHFFWWLYCNSGPFLKVMRRIPAYHVDDITGSMSMGLSPFLSKWLPVFLSKSPPAHFHGVFMALSLGLRNVSNNVRQPHWWLQRAQVCKRLFEHAEETNPKKKWDHLLKLTRSLMANPKSVLIIRFCL